MNRSMITSSVTMGQMQTKIDTIANNISNVNTTGYKGRDVQFSSLLSRQMDNLPGEANRGGRLTPDGIRLGSGAQAADTSLNLKPGTIKMTERALDLALSVQDHFFQIESTGENGEPTRIFTRDGAFYLQPNAENPNMLDLVTKDGHFVEGTGGRIQIPAQYEKITFRESGEITVTMGNGETLDAKNFRLAQILRPDLLQSVGDNEWALPDLAPLNVAEADVLEGVEANEASLQQGALEMSNVDLSSEMTELINVQRSYQLNARAFKTADQTAGLVNSIR
jgi:flagellar basal-body rod protein FlgG